MKNLSVNKYSGFKLTRPKYMLNYGEITLLHSLKFYALHAGENASIFNTWQNFVMNYKLCFMNKKYLQKLVPV